MSLLIFITKRKKITEISQHLSEITYTNEETLFSDVSYEQLIDYILELPKNYRDVLYLNLVYDYSFNEIGKLLAITAENARKRAQRGKSILQEKIKEELL